MQRVNKMRLKERGAEKVRRGKALFRTGLYTSKGWGGEGGRDLQKRGGKPQKRGTKRICLKSVLIYAKEDLGGENRKRSSAAGSNSKRGIKEIEGDSINGVSTKVRQTTKRWGGVEVKNII